MVDIQQELAKALDDHIRQVQQDGLTACALYPAGVLLTYGDLCSRAAKGSRARSVGIARGIGRYLSPMADAQREAGRPPTDCLVVRQKDKQPGSGFSPDGKFNRAEWKKAVLSAINYTL